MDEKTKELLREMRDKIDAMLSEESPPGRMIGSWDWLELWENAKGRREVRSANHGGLLGAGDCWASLTRWLAMLLDAQRPRVYKDGDELPETYIWWHHSKHCWDIGHGNLAVWTGMLWLPLPPDYKP